MLFLSPSPLPDAARSAVATALNACLCDHIALWSALKTAHWNVKGDPRSGKSAREFHLMFDTLADSADNRADQIAERVTTLGALAQASPHLVAATSGVADYPLSVTAPGDHLKALDQRYRMVNARMREAIAVATTHGDRTTVQFLDTLLGEMEHDAGFITAEFPAFTT